jgi:hypothetical protein
MSKRRSEPRYEESEDSDEITNIDNIEAYINASEMYLEALKLSDGSNVSAGYMVGITAVYFGKAFLEFTSSDNTEAIKGSLKEAMSAYVTASSFCESNNIGKQFVYTSKLIISALIIELKNL